MESTWLLAQMTSLSVYGASRSLQVEINPCCTMLDLITRIESDSARIQGKITGLRKF